MREEIATSIERLWPTGRGLKPSLAAVEHGAGMDDVLDMIEQLVPPDEAQFAPFGRTPSRPAASWCIRAG